jgi:Clathrin adaptor complex small chain
VGGKWGRSGCLIRVLFRLHQNLTLFTGDDSYRTTPLRVSKMPIKYGAQRRWIQKIILTMQIATLSCCRGRAKWYEFSLLSPTVLFHFLLIADCVLFFPAQRLAKWFTTLSPKEKAKIVKDVTQLVLSRRTRMCNFLEYKGTCSSPTTARESANTSRIHLPQILQSWINL